MAWIVGERRLIELDTWTPPSERRAVRAVAGLTLGQYASEWLETRRTKQGPIKPRTKADYRRLLERHILPTFGTVRMRTVTPDQVTRWYLSLNSNTPTERAHAYQLLNAIFATAADPRVRIVTTNPCQIAGAGPVAPRPL